MTVFIQEFTAGPNATVAAVAGIPDRPGNAFQSGTVFVADATIIEGISINSPQIGPSQGIYATSSLDGANSHGLFSFSFTNKRYNGSTLEFQGRSIQRARIELGCIGRLALLAYVEAGEVACLS
ncbi:dirigent protein 11-like [Coffea arabica]|uniref:Dirigent protein n=1 Tax=Coffea arabica TaxID=13443 RepID=A0A6P6SAU6_COFAR|nr:dirigent protein 11-like [Coffea arabica]